MTMSHVDWFLRLDVHQPRSTESGDGGGMGEHPSNPSDRHASLKATGLEPGVPLEAAEQSQVGPGNSAEHCRTGVWMFCVTREPSTTLA